MDPDACILLPFSIKCTSFYHTHVLQELFKELFGGQKERNFLKILHDTFITVQKESNT